MRLFISSIQSAGNNKSGICLSFDDYTRVDSWVAYHNDIGKFTNWKATFYVNLVNQVGIDGYKLLHDYGHEIANHTTNHFNGVNNFIASGGTPEEYYLTYLKPLDDWIVSNGMTHPETFRYPFNFVNDEVSDWLLSNNKYSIITPGNHDYVGAYPINSNGQFFYDYNPANYQWALQTDRHQPGHNEQVFMDLLEYAKNNNRIAMFFGHSIGQSTWSIAITNYSLMEKITNYVNDNGMKFYTFNELASLTP